MTQTLAYCTGSFETSIVFVVLRFIEVLLNKGGVEFSAIAAEMEEAAFVVFGHINVFAEDVLEIIAIW